MKIKLAATCFVIATLLAPVVGYTADSDTDRSHPKTFVKDSVITTKIKAKLAEEKISSLAHIKVDTHSKGVVVLKGRVKTQEEADKAVSIARETEGVTSVKSFIKIKKATAASPGSDRSHPMTFVKDSVITTKIKTKLAAEHPGSMKHIQVDTDKDGVVWLSGTANTQAEIDQAVAIARNTEGVKSVKSNLHIKKDD
jgi:hyperosmotically inducible protein